MNAIFLVGFMVLLAAVAVTGAYLSLKTEDDEIIQQRIKRAKTYYL